MDKIHGRKLSDKAKATIILSLMIAAVVILIAVPYFVNVLNSGRDQSLEVEIPNSGEVEPSEISEPSEPTEPSAPSTSSEPAEGSYSTNETVYYYTASPSAAAPQPASQPAPEPTPAPEAPQTTSVDNPGESDSGYTATNVDDLGIGDPMITE